MRISQICTLAVLSVAVVFSEGQSFTLQQALSTPFASDLVASPKKGKFAWVEDQEGRRNLWIAEPTAGESYKVRQLTHYDKDDGQEIYDIALTPDAEQLIYVRGGDAEYPTRLPPNPALDPAGTSQNIWILSITGGEPRKLGEGFDPVISPSGNQLAFLSRGQIYTVELGADQSSPKQLLHTRGDLSSLTWAPDGHALAFLSERGDHNFIGVFDLHTQEVVYLDPSTDKDWYPTWSPDSQQIAFVRVPSNPERTGMEDHRTDNPWSIHIADAATGKGHKIWQAATGRGSAYHEIPGKQLLWAAGNILVFPWEADGWSHLYAISTQGGNPTLLTPGEFEAEHPLLRVKGKSILYASNQDDIDRRHLWEVSISGGRAKQLTQGTGAEVEAVEAEGEIALLHADEHTPLRPAWMDAGGKMQDFAPDLVPASFPGSSFVRPQQVIFPAADSLPIHGQLFLPSNANDGKRHPALVFFHGGSRRQMLLGFHYMEYYSNAYAMNQYLASLGYIVLSVNYRSGIGYGLDFREALHYGRGGASEYKDILGAGNYLHSRKDVDSARIGVWGGSWGGYLTALALARSSDIFAAGVDMHGVHDWVSISERRASSPDPATEEKTIKMLWDSSPISSVSTWKSPVLLIQGDDDRNVPFSQNVQMANALRKQGVEYEELIFPDEIHTFLLHRSWLAAYQAEADFFQRHLLNSSSGKGK